MNKYGARAMQAWRENLPEEYSQIEDPQSHFAELGERIEAQVLETETSLLQSSPRSEDFLEDVGLRNMTRLQAEELVMDDLVWSQMPATQEDEDLEGRPAVMDPRGMPLDQSHPLWAMEADESVTDEQFGEALGAWHQQLREQGYQA